MIIICLFRCWLILLFCLSTFIESAQCIFYASLNCQNSITLLLVFELPRPPDATRAFSSQNMILYQPWASKQALYWCDCVLFLNHFICAGQACLLKRPFLFYLYSLIHASIALSFKYLGLSVAFSRSPPSSLFSPTPECLVVFTRLEARVNRQLGH